jgi:hypothetical protein
MCTNQLRLLGIDPHNSILLCRDQVAKPIIYDGEFLVASKIVLKQNFCFDQNLDIYVHKQ